MNLEDLKLKILQLQKQVKDYNPTRSMPCISNAENELNGIRDTMEAINNSDLTEWFSRSLYNKELYEIQRLLREK